MTRLDEIRKRLEEATPGPWDWYDSDPYWLWQRIGEGKHDFGKPIGVERNDVTTNADSDIIAHAPEDVSYLLQRVEKLEKGLERIIKIDTESVAPDRDILIEIYHIAKDVLKDDRGVDA